MQKTDIYIVSQRSRFGPAARVGGAVVFYQASLCHTLIVHRFVIIPDSFIAATVNMSRVNVHDVHNVCDLIPQLENV